MGPFVRCFTGSFKTMLSGMANRELLCLGPRNLIFDIYSFELSNHTSFMTEPENDGPQRRPILVLMKKNLGMKVKKLEEIN